MLEELELGLRAQNAAVPAAGVRQGVSPIDPLGTIPQIDGDTKMTEVRPYRHYLGIEGRTDAADASVEEPAYGAFLNWMHFSTQP